MKKLILSIVMILAGTVLSGGAYAVQQTGTLDVSVNVFAACTMSVTGITFPDYTGATVSANGNVTVSCPVGLPYNIALDGGLHTAGSPGLIRVVTNISNNYIPYALTKDAGGNQEWGDSDFAATHTAGTSLPDTGTGVFTPHTVYGFLSSGPTVPSGLYTDTVTVTLYY